MDPFIIAQTIDLAGENPAKTYRQPLAAGDSAAHRWEVRIVRGGKAADLTGCTAAVLARREGGESGVTVRQSAAIDGNVASAEFIPEVYALGGRLLAVMVISDASGRVVTSAALRMQGKQYTTDSISDPEGTIPSLDALLARYEDMVTATGESRAATQAAQEATEETRAALTDAQAALATAQQAVADAQDALATADTAAQTANAAAGKIDNMTVSATPVSTGTATAALSTVDGHYHLALGLPKGDTGATPQISVQVQTGAAGSEASVSVSGTAEEPVIHLTIPRGDAGKLGNLTINGKSPDGSGAVTLTPEDLGAATAEEVSQIKSNKLDKTATAADSSKLGGVAASDYALKTDTAPDSSKLGGVAASDYALKTDTAPDSSKLGGVAASDYALKTEMADKLDKTATAADSSKFGGELPEAYAKHGGAVMARLSAKVTTTSDAQLPLIELLNTNSDIFEVADGAIKVKQDGYFMYTASVMIADGAGTDIYIGLQVQKNGHYLADAYGSTGGKGYGVLPTLTRVAQFAAGDVLTLWYKGSTSTNIGIAASDRTSLSVWMIT